MESCEVKPEGGHRGWLSALIYALAYKSLHTLLSQENSNPYNTIRRISMQEMLLLPWCKGQDVRYINSIRHVFLSPNSRRYLLGPKSILA